MAVIACSTWSLQEKPTGTNSSPLRRRNPSRWWGEQNMRFRHAGRGPVPEEERRSMYETLDALLRGRTRPENLAPLRSRCARRPTASSGPWTTGA